LTGPFSYRRFKVIASHFDVVVSKKSRVTVTIDGAPYEVDEGISLRDALLSTGAPFDEGSIVAIGQEGGNNVRDDVNLIMSNSKGDVVLSITDRPLANALIGMTGAGRPSIVSVDANSLTVGPFVTEDDCGLLQRECNEGDIIFDQAGAERSNTVLRLCKKRHTAAYAMIGSSPVGRVVSGMQTLRSLDHRDVVELRMPSRSATAESFILANDLDRTWVKEGMKVVTAATIVLDDKVPESAELFLSISQTGWVEVCDCVGSFARIAGLDDLTVPERNPVKRKRGSVTIRNEGKGLGQIYVYRIERASEESHTVIGKVSQGMELFDIARPGDRIALRTIPSRVSTIGLTQSKAMGMLRAKGLGQERTGGTEDDDVVVDQSPRFTVEIARTGSVITRGVRANDLVSISLYDELAPRSVRYFRSMVGLNMSSVGSLEIMFPYSSIGGAVLLSTVSEGVSNMTIDPENQPTEIVREGEIGLTNSINSKMGTIGIRMRSSDEFGPSCEVFDSTNIIGAVNGTDVEKIKKKRMGERIYLIEEDRSPSFRPQA